MSSRWVGVSVCGGCEGGEGVRCPITQLMTFSGGGAVLGGAVTYYGLCPLRSSPLPRASLAVCLQTHMRSLETVEERLLLEAPPLQRPGHMPEAGCEHLGEGVDAHGPRLLCCCCHCCCGWGWGWGWVAQLVGLPPVMHRSTIRLAPSYA